MTADTIRSAMRRIKRTLQIGMVVALASLLSVSVPQAGRARAASGPSLVISQLKITSSNGQFITLYNSTDVPLDMGKYQVEYFNSYDLNKATSSRLIALSGSLPPHSYFMLNDDSLLLCYRLTVDSISLGLSSTSGFIEVLSAGQASPGGPVSPIVQDYVGWSKSAASGAQTLPANASAFLRRLPVGDGGEPVIAQAGSGAWQAVRPDDGNPCNLVTDGATPTEVTIGAGQLFAADEPPATIIAMDGSAASPETSIPAADIGLKAPSITELLPNPSGTGNDGTDEFIELYNSNSRSFDLGGFSLQTGETTTHSYTFPAGTSLPPNGFTAFYAAATRLTLSNSGSQAQLLDPGGKGISSSRPYGTAKDGQAWALAKGQWYWTTQPTPGKANIIKQPSSSVKATGKKTGAKTKSATPLTRIKTAGAKTGSIGPDAAAASPIHLWILALVAGAALLYGAYEYRADMANHFHRARTYFRHRGRHR